MGELNTMSINFLDPEKCKFYLNPNGFAALKTEDKDYRRVRLLRTLPLHRPFEYISVSDMDKNEIGIIKNAADFPSESREIIEKDLAAGKLAEAVDADMLVILTGVEKICLEYGTASEQPIDHMTTAQAKKYMEEGQFGEGTMKPKVEAALDLSLIHI